MQTAGAIRVARIGGIAIDIHLSFSLVIFWGAWQGWVQFGGLLGIGLGVLTILLLFFCVLLHELGHSLQARGLGLNVRQILLMPLGGLAHLESSPSEPWQELLFTLAGPIVNLGLALIFGIIAYVLEPFSILNWQEQLAFFSRPDMITLLRYLFWVNASLFLFNMLPAFPIDGGRIIRAAIAMLTDYEKGTRIATQLGYVMAVGMLLFGVLGWPPGGIPSNYLVAMFGLIVALGARYEDVYVKRQRALVRLEAGELASQPEHALEPWDILTRKLAAELLRCECAYPVIVEGRVVGMLSYRDVQRQVRSLPRSAVVAHFMRTDFPVLSAYDTLWVALREMERANLDILPVMEADEFRGIVSLDDIRNSWRFKNNRRQRQNVLRGDIK